MLKFMMDRRGEIQNKLSLFVTVLLFIFLWIVFTYNTTSVLPEIPWNTIPFFAAETDETAFASTVVTNDGTVAITTSPGTYRNNRLVYEPIVYTVTNISEKPVAYLSGCAIKNPSHCLATGPSCISNVHPTMLCSATPLMHFLNPQEEVTSLYYPIAYAGSFEPSGNYRIQFHYLMADRPADELSMSMEQFLEESTIVYSDPFKITQIPLDKTTTTELCQSWDPALTATTDLQENNCRATMVREFGDIDHPISVTQLVNQADALIDQSVSIEGELVLNTRETTNTGDTAHLFAVLQDSFYHSTTPIFLRSEGSFVRCPDSELYLDDCNGWKRHEHYVIHGLLKKAPVPDLAGNHLYIDITAWQVK